MEDPDTGDLVQALGLAVAMMGAMMEGARVVPRGEVGRKLAMLASVTRETEPVQADILKQWAVMAAQAGGAPN